MRGRVRRALVVMLLGLTFPALSRAQEPATSLGDLPQWVRIGDRITVVDTTGRKVTGSLAGVKPESLALALNGGSRDFPSDSIQRITRRDADPVSNGALIGATVGAGFFLLAVVSNGACDWEGCGGVVVLGTLFYGSIGAGIGVAVDAMVPGREVVIFRRPGGRATLNFSPRLTPHRQGVTFSLSF